MGATSKPGGRTSGTLKKLLLQGILCAGMGFFLLPACQAATVTWDNGGGDGLWSTATNWSGDFVPRTGDIVVFDGTSNTPSTVDATFVGSVGEIQLNAGYTNTVTLQRALTLVSTGGQRGRMFLKAGTFDANGQTLSATGHVVVDGGTYAASSAIQTFNSGIDILSGTFTATSGPIDINGNLILRGGTLDGGAAAINIANDFIKTGGTFTPGTGTVVFDGASTGTIDINSSETFNNLTFAPSNNVIKHIAPDDALIVNGTLTLADGLIHTGTVEARGNISQASGFDGGNALLLINGTASHTFTGSSTLSAGTLPPMQINKTGGTLTLAGTIRTTNNWKYVGGTVDPGTSQVVWGAALQLDGSQTFNDVTWNTAGLVTITRSTTITVNGTTNFADGSVTTGTVVAKGDINQGVNADSGTGTLRIGGTGDQTFTGSATTATGDVADIEINKPSGTLNLAGTIRSTNDWKYLAGTINPGTSTLVKAGGYIFGSHTLNTLDVRGTSRMLKNTAITLNENFIHTTGSLTLNGALIVNGDTTLTGGTIDGLGRVEARGANITQGSGHGGGTAKFFINGTGAQTFTGNATTAAGTLPDVTINKASGTLTLAGTIRTTNDWSYISGTMSSPGATLVLGASMVMTGSHTIDNLVTNTNGTITISKGTTITVPTSLTLTDGTINTGNIVALGDINQASTADGGTAQIQITGTGTQTFTGTATSTAGSIPNIDINKSSGSLDLAGTIRTASFWKYSTGTVNPGTSTVVFAGGRITGIHPLNNVEIRGTSTLTKNSTITVNGSFIHTNSVLVVAGTFIVNGTSFLTGGSMMGFGNLEARGDIVQDAAYGGGTAFLLINGTGAQTFTGNATNSAGQLPAIDINKPSGTLTLMGTIRTGSNWTYTGGTVDAETNDSTVVFGGASGLLRSSGPGGAQMSFDNVIVESSTRTLGRNIDINGNLSIITSGSLNTGAQSFSINLAGNWTNTSSNGFVSNNSMVTFDGTGTQTVNTGGTNANQDFGGFTVNKASGSVVLGSSALLVNMDVLIQAGTLDVGVSSQPITVLGNWRNLGTFIAQNGTLTLQGTTSSSLRVGTSSYNNLTINKTSGTASFDDVYMPGVNPLVINGNLTISDGELVQGAQNITVNGTTSLAVASSTWTNRSSGDIILGNTLSNAGIILWNGNDGAAGDTDDIALSSTIPGTQRSMTGAGTFTLTDLNITDINATVTANSSTNTSNNTGITFAAGTGYKIWDGGGVDNNWNTGANWSGDTAPAVGDSVLFDGTSSKDVTMNVAVTVSGFFIRGYGGTITHGGSALTVSNNFNQTGGIFTGGAGTVTISGDFTQTGGTFNAPNGTFNIAKNIFATGGTFNAGSNTVTLTGGGGYIDTSNVTFNNLTVNPATAGSLKLIADSTTVIVNGTLGLSEGALNQTIIPAGGTVAARGNITQLATFDAGTALLIIDGTGTQTFTGSATTTTGNLPNLEINKASGTLNLAGTIRTLNAWTYTTGTLAPGVSIVVFGAGSEIRGTHTLADVVIQGSSILRRNTVLTVSGNFTIATAISFTVDGQVLVTGDTALTDGTIDGVGTFNIRGANITQASTFDGGIGHVTIDGPGAQLFTGSATASAGQLPPLLIAKPSGTLNLAGTIRTTSNWIYNAGTINAGSSTVVFSGGIVVDGSHTLTNVTVNGTAVRFTTNTVLTTTGTLTLTDGTIENGVIAAQGDIVEASTFDGGTGTIRAEGVGMQTFTGSATTTAGALPNFEINKTGGSLDLVGTIRTTNEWTYLQGSLNAGTSLVVFAGGTITGDHTLNAVEIRGTTVQSGGYVLTIANTLTIPTAVSFAVHGRVVVEGDLNLTDGSIDGLGSVNARGANINVASTFDGGTGQLILDGTGAQLLTGGGSVAAGTLPILTINKTSGVLSLASTIRTTTHVDYVTGSMSPGTSEMVLSGTLSVASSPTFNNLTLNGNGTTYTLSPTGNVTVLGNLTLTDGLMNQGNIRVKGDITQASTFDGGSGTIFIDGTGTQTFTGSATSTAGTLTDITINKPSGQLNLAGTIRTAGQGVGAWDLVAGTVNPGTSSLVFNGDSTMSGSQTLNNVEILGSGANFFLDDSITLNVTGTLTLTDGNINGGVVNATGDVIHGSAFDGGTGFLTITGPATRTINLTGTGLLPATTLNAAAVTINGPSSGTTTFSNDFTIQNGTFAIDGGNITLSRGMRQTGGLVTGGAGTVTSTLYSQISGGIFTGAGGTMDYNGPFTISGGVYTASSGSTFLGGTFVFSGGIFSDNGGTVTIDGGSHTNFATTNPSFTNLTIAGNANSNQVINSESTFIVNGTLTLTDGNLNIGTVEVPNAMVHASTFDGGTGLINIIGPGTRTINLPSGQLPAVTLNAPNVTLSRTSTGGMSFDNTFTLDAGTFDYNQGDITFNGEFIQNGGTFLANGVAETMNVVGNFNLNNGNFTSTTGTLNLNRDLILQAAATFNNNAGTVQRLGVEPHRTNVPTSITFNNLQIDDGTVINVIEGSDTMIIEGTLTFVNGRSYGGLFDARGNVHFTGNAWDGGTTPLLFSGSANQTLSIAPQIPTTNPSEQRFDGNVTLNKPSGTVTVQAAAWLLNEPGQTLTLTSGTLDFATNNVPFTAPTTTTINGGTLVQGTGDFTLNALNIDGGALVGGSGDITQTGNFSQSDGSFTATSGTYALAGNFLRTGGTFAHNNGSVVLNGADQTLSGITTFFNLTKNSPGATLLIPSGPANVLTIAGDLTLTGASGDPMFIRSDGLGTATIAPLGTRTVSDLDVKDNENTVAPQMPCTVGCVNAGNTILWFTVATGSSQFPLFTGGGGGAPAQIVQQTPPAIPQEPQQPTIPTTPLTPQTPQTPVEETPEEDCFARVGRPAPFTDIRGHWAESYIIELYQRCIVSGRQKQIFRPDDDVTRAELVKIVVKTYNYGEADFKAFYPDVQDKVWYTPFIVRATELGIINGYGNGKFQPDIHVNRAEALKILMNGRTGSGQLMKTGSGTMLLPTKFADIATDDWFYPYVYAADVDGIVTGFPLKLEKAGSVSKFIPETWTFKDGITDKRLLVVKEILMQLGFYYGPIDTFADNRLKMGVTTLQIVKGLAPSGELDTATMNALRQETLQPKEVKLFKPGQMMSRGEVAKLDLMLEGLPMLPRAELRPSPR